MAEELNGKGQLWMVELTPLLNACAASGKPHGRKAARRLPSPTGRLPPARPPARLPFWACAPSPPLCSLPCRCLLLPSTPAGLGSPPSHAPYCLVYKFPRPRPDP